MKYNKQLTLKNGKQLTLRNGTAEDGEEVLKIFNETHAETDFLLSYPDENNFTVESEREFLVAMMDSPREIEIVALIDGHIVGSAGIESRGGYFKVKHRCELGISVYKAYWGLGIGSALMEACVECARSAGYTQIELEVVADNVRAVELYKKYGFTEYGRNPRGFNFRSAGYRELVMMRREI